MQTIKRLQGFTLIELMITVAIIGVLAGIAVPAYQGYITTSETNAADANAHSLAGFEDTYFYDNNTYLAGTYDPSGTGTDTLTAALSWTPSGDKGKYKYVVTAKAGGVIASSYTVTVTYNPDTTISATVSKP